MELLRWDNSMSVGNLEIDSQHQLFVSLINKIAAQVATDDDQTLLEGLLRELLKYAEFHFLSEENMMRSCGYAGAQHQKEHQILLAELRNRLFSLRQENIDFERLFDFLLSWFKEHTATVDTELAQSLQATTER